MCYTHGPAWSSTGAVQLSSTVLKQKVVFGFGDQFLALPRLFHYIQRLDHVVDVIGADQRQSDVFKNLSNTNRYSDLI